MFSKSFSNKISTCLDVKNIIKDNNCNKCKNNLSKSGNRHIDDDYSNTQSRRNKKNIVHNKSLPSSNLNVAFIGLVLYAGIIISEVFLRHISFHNLILLIFYPIKLSMPVAGNDMLAVEFSWFATLSICVGIYDKFLNKISYYFASIFVWYQPLIWLIRYIINTPNSWFFWIIPFLGLLFFWFQGMAPDEFDMMYK